MVLPSSQRRGEIVEKFVFSSLLINHSILLARSWPNIENEWALCLQFSEFRSAREIIIILMRNAVCSWGVKCPAFLVFVVFVVVVFCFLSHLCMHTFTTLLTVYFGRVGVGKRIIIWNTLKLQIINILWCWNVWKDLKKQHSLKCIYRWIINLFAREKYSACYQN